MSNLYLTNASATPAATGGAETTRWLLSGSPGSSAKICNKNCTGTANVLVTDSQTAGTDGNTVGWYSNPLANVTIAGQITASLWGVESSAANNAAPAIGVYLCDATGAVISAIVNPATSGSQGALELATAAAAKTCTIVAATVVDTVVAAGQRLKVTLVIDSAVNQGGAGTIAASGSAQMYINGATGVTGQSQIAFTETILSIGSGQVFPAVAGRSTNPGREAPSIISGF